MQPSPVYPAIPPPPTTATASTPSPTPWRRFRCRVLSVVLLFVLLSVLAMGVILSSLPATPPPPLPTPRHVLLHHPLIDVFTRPVTSLTHHSERACECVASLHDALSLPAQNICSANAASSVALAAHTSHASAISANITVLSFDLLSVKREADALSRPGTHHRWADRIAYHLPFLRRASKLTHLRQRTDAICVALEEDTRALEAVYAEVQTHMALLAEEARVARRGIEARAAAAAAAATAGGTAPYDNTDKLQLLGYRQAQLYEDMDALYLGTQTYVEDRHGEVRAQRNLVAAVAMKLDNLVAALRRGRAGARGWDGDAEVLRTLVKEAVKMVEELAGEGVWEGEGGKAGGRGPGKG
ncbi:hypothetical protein NKR19_g4862 [Coniochaeta hoffmannii]|uniref:Uncharacterized protein n=1 Tax=Coniochaeta hoffmannii TaxID=91930 RepID=A0AA38RKS9_9PEZI|nr:hypothetical protein NKR19_g4862 [Coniochaeta hoffmannii]